MSCSVVKYVINLKKVTFGLATTDATPAVGFEGLFPELLITPTLVFSVVLSNLGVLVQPALNSEVQAVLTLPPTPSLVLVVQGEVF